MVHLFAYIKAESGNLQSYVSRHTLTCKEVWHNLGDRIVPEWGWKVALWRVQLLMLQ